MGDEDISLTETHQLPLLGVPHAVFWSCDIFLFIFFQQETTIRAENKILWAANTL